MFSGARTATLVAFVAIAVAAAFAAVDRTRAGTPSATLVPDGAASNSRFIVSRAPAGDPLHRGDRIEIDDAGSLAAYTYQVLEAGSTLRVRRLSPAPESCGARFFFSASAVTAPSKRAAARRTPRSSIATIRRSCGFSRPGRRSTCAMREPA